YASKYEITLWNAAGLYLVVGILLFISLIFTFSRLNIWLRMSLASLFLWISFHIYEILIVIAPAYIFAFLLNCLITRESIKLKNFMPYTFPSIMTAIHLAIMASSPSKVWRRDPNLEYDPISLIARVPGTVSNGLQTLIGQKHFDLVKENLFFYKNWVVDEQSVSMYLAIFLIGLIVWIFQSSRNDKKRINQQKHEIKYPPKQFYPIAFLCSVYVILASLALNIANDGVVLSSRLTFLGSIGLSVLIALLIEAIKDCLKRSCSSKLILVSYLTSIVLISALVVAESMAFTTIVYQFHTSAQFDNNIRRQIINMDLSVSNKNKVVLFTPASIQWIEINGKRQNPWTRGIKTFLSNLDSIQLSYEYGLFKTGDRLLSYAPVFINKKQHYDSALSTILSWENPASSIIPLFLNKHQ
ncbi:MAG TPA: hypothetical protein V6D33_13455, partial [Cyanophyceae cyanobacterium]